jgi:hypothetical protein
MLNIFILCAVILVVAGTVVCLSIRDHGRLVDVLRQSLTVENDDLKDRP